jgi:hypothetical protein
LFRCAAKAKTFLGGCSKNFYGSRKRSNPGMGIINFIRHQFYILRSDLGSAKAQKELIRLRKHIFVSAVDAEVVDAALNAEWNDLEDAIQYYSAEFSKCKALITRNKRDYPDKTNLPVFTPIEFISNYL